MSFLLDTNVVSETSKSLRDAAVERWIGLHSDQLYLSVITITEVRAGLDAMSNGKRRQVLDFWFRNQILRDYENRILPITSEIAEQAGRHFAKQKLRGHTPDLADTLIAATASVHGLTLATRNQKHFIYMDIESCNPFD